MFGSGRQLKREVWGSKIQLGKKVHTVTILQILHFCLFFRTRKLLQSFAVALLGEKNYKRYLLKNYKKGFQEPIL